MIPARSVPRAARTRALVGVVALVVAVTLGGCGGSSSHPQSSPSGGSSSNGAGAAGPLPSRVSLGQVAGIAHKANRQLFKKHRASLLKDVGRAVDTWIDGGWVGVSYPRKSFPQAFAAFTKPARQDAVAQQSLMTNASLGPSISGVEVKHRRVVVDFLAPNGRAAGATAHVTLVFTTTGHTQRTVTVVTRLFLVPGNGSHWRIFGFDATKGEK